MNLKMLLDGLLPVVDFLCSFFLYKNATQLVLNTQAAEMEIPFTLGGISEEWHANYVAGHNVSGWQRLQSLELGDE